MQLRPCESVRRVRFGITRRVDERVCSREFSRGRTLARDTIASQRFSPRVVPCETEGDVVAAKNCNSLASASKMSTLTSRARAPVYMFTRIATRSDYDAPSGGREIATRKCLSLTFRNVPIASPLAQSKRPYKDTGVWLLRRGPSGEWVMRWSVARRK